MTEAKTPGGPNLLVAVRRWFEIRGKVADAIAEWPDSADILSAYLVRLGYNVQPRDVTISPETLAPGAITVAVAKLPSPIGPVLVFVRHYRGQWWTIEATEPRK